MASTVRISIIDSSEQSRGRTRTRRRRRRQPEETQTETETSGDGDSRGRTRTRRRRWRRRRRQPQEMEMETETSGDGDSRGRTRTRRQRRRRRRKRAEPNRRRRRRQTQPDAETVMERAPKRQNDPSLTGDEDPHRWRQPQPDKAFKAQKIAFLKDIKDKAFRDALDARFACVKLIYKRRAERQEELEKERRLALANPFLHTMQERRRIEDSVENEYQKIQKSGQSCTHSDASWGGPAEDYIRSELRELGIISRATPSEQRELEIISVKSESSSSDTRS